MRITAVMNLPACDRSRKSNVRQQWHWQRGNRAVAVAEETPITEHVQQYACKFLRNR